MSLGEKQKRLRHWFQRHGWHTGNTPTDKGFFLESPIENCAGLSHFAVDPKTGEQRMFSLERVLEVELDRFNGSVVDFSIYERKHWWKKDSKPDLGIRGYDWVPSDDFDKWSRQPTASVSLPAQDIVKLAELIKAAQEEQQVKCVSTASLPKRWIGVNASYDSIKCDYSNDRIRQESAKEENTHAIFLSAVIKAATIYCVKAHTQKPIKTHSENDIRSVMGFVVSKRTIPNTNVLFAVIILETGE